MRLICMLGLAALLAGAPAATQPAPAPAPAPLPRGDTTLPDYASDAAWLCRPGVDDGTCSTNLDAIAVTGKGTRTPAPYSPAASPPIDCFYVYPTASNDRSMFASMTPDAGVKRSTHAQAARLGARCRLFVPVYHQVTSAGLGEEMAHDADVTRVIGDIPYRDVLAAWRAYLARDNHGRGVVLVGHSQGAMILKRLIAEQIDGRPAQKLLVAAYLAGNPALDMGSFHAIPPCRAADQTGCLVAWSTYLDGYDGARVFGGARAGAAPLCVNPAAVAGGRGLAEAYLSRPALAPASDPPYVEAVGQISLECVADAHGAVLRARIEPGKYAGLLAEALGHYARAPSWGLHTLDINLVEGNMLDLIGTQAEAWRKAH